MSLQGTSLDKSPSFGNPFNVINSEMDMGEGFLPERSLKYVFNVVKDFIFNSNDHVFRKVTK